MAFTTATSTTTTSREALVLQGESFVRGINGTNRLLEEGPGILAFGLPVCESRVPDGDLASGVLRADRAGVCP